MNLYSGTTDPFSHRCRIVLYEKGMDFQVIDVDLFNKPEDIAVIIEATHHCVKSRGVEDQNCDTMTSKLGGVFREQGVRMEFFTLIKRA